MILSLSLGLLFSANVASAVPGSAEVKLVVDTATVTRASGGTSPLTTGMVLGPGDTVTTGKDSSVFLWLGINGESLIVAANSTVNLEELEITNVEDGIVKTTVNVTKGKVVGVVKNKLASASKFEIKTIKGTARIRGTQYVFDEDGTLIVLEGAVTYTYTENGVTKSVDVAQGQQFKIGDAQPSVISASYEIDPANLAALVETMNGSGFNFTTSSSTAAIINGLAEALGVSPGEISKDLVAAGVLKERAFPVGITAQPIDTTVVSRPN